MMSLNQLVTMLLAITMVAVSLGVLSLNSIRNEHNLSIDVVLLIFAGIGLLTFGMQYISLMVEKTAHTKISFFHSFWILVGILIIEFVTFFNAWRLTLLVLNFISLNNLSSEKVDSMAQITHLLVSNLMASLMYFLAGYLIYFGPLDMKFRPSFLLAIMRILFFPLIMWINWISV